MIYPENQKVSALIDLLEQTDLFTSRELNVMEEYLLGETEGKLPEQLHYRDMSQIGKETAKKRAAFYRCFCNNLACDCIYLFICYADPD